MNVCVFVDSIFLLRGQELRFPSQEQPWNMHRAEMPPSKGPLHCSAAGGWARLAPQPAGELGAPRILNWVARAWQRVGLQKITCQRENASLSLRGREKKKNLPCNAEEASLIPDPGRSHMPQRNYWTRTSQLERCAPQWKLPHDTRKILCATATTKTRHKQINFKNLFTLWCCAWPNNPRKTVSAVSSWDRSCLFMRAGRVQLCDLMDSSPPGSSIHGIFQARILEWVAISYSRGFSLSRDWTPSSLAGWFFTIVLNRRHWPITK